MLWTFWNHYFVDDGQGGAFHITSRFFLEATEGHGVRFSTMLQSFTVLPQENTGSETEG